MPNNPQPTTHINTVRETKGIRFHHKSADSLIRQLKSIKSISITTSSKKQSKALNSKTFKSPSDKMSMKESKTAKSLSMKQSKTSKSTKTEKSLSSKNSKSSKSMDSKSSKKSKASLKSKSSKQALMQEWMDKKQGAQQQNDQETFKSSKGNGLSAKSFKTTSKNSKSSKSMKSKSSKHSNSSLKSKSSKQGLMLETMKKNQGVQQQKEHHHHHNDDDNKVTKSVSESLVVNHNKMDHDVSGIKEMDPLIQDAPDKPSLVSSTPFQLGLAGILLIASLLLHYFKMKKTKNSNGGGGGGVYKPISTNAGEAEMTELGSEDLHAEYGMDDDDDEFGAPAQ